MSFASRAGAAACLLIAAIAAAGFAADAPAKTMTARFEEGLALFESGERDKARALIEPLHKEAEAKVAKDADDADAQYALGRILLLKQEDAAAIRHLSRAAALSPKDVSRHYWLGAAYGYAERWQESADTLAKAVELDPKDIKSAGALVDALGTLGKHDDAIAAARKLAQQHPDRSDAAVNVSVALERAGRMKEAEEEIAASARRFPDSARAQANLGQVHQRHDRHAEAVAQYQRATQLDADDWRSWAKLVQLNAALGKPDESDKSRAKVIALHKAGKVQEEKFCREQFKVGGSPVMAFEHFALAGDRPVRYAFMVLGPDGAGVQRRISLGSYELTTQIAREAGSIGPDQRMWHLDAYDKAGHETFGMFTAEPAYADARRMVVEILEGKRKPQSGTKVQGEKVDVQGR